MAEIIIKSKKEKRSKLPAPRVDLTPMVDLGFLLITFFLFTTSLRDHKQMEINMPAKSESPTQIPSESTITIIPCRNHQYAYYHGNLEKLENMQLCSVEIRTLIMNKQSAVKNLPNSFSAEAHKIHVVIKPSNECKYEDLVKLLDEMLINQVSYYAISDLTAHEQNILAQRLKMPVER